MNLRRGKLTFSLYSFRAGLTLSFRIRDDLVAEAINDQSDGVDAPETFVKGALWHRYPS